MKSLSRLLPVFIAFYCMGFIDIVGTAVNLASIDFKLDATLMQFLTFMIFVWFFIFSIPTGIVQDRLGKKNVVLFALMITVLAMILPFIVYSFTVLIVSLALLGIGNTVIQVSLNPLLYDVSPEGNYSSNMSLSQFIKSVAAFFGPLLTVFFAKMLDDWRYIFLFYGILSALSMIWLSFTPVIEKARSQTPARLGPCLKLLGNGYVLSMVLGIFIVVGLDVGMNTGVPRFLERHGFTSNQAISGISIYIFALMISRFLGAIILKKLNARAFLLISAFLTLAGLVFLIFDIDPLFTKIAILLVGLGSANIFPLIFSLSIERMPDRSNEISGLMIMAISGGALFPLIMGIIIDSLGLTASIVFLLLISLYLGYLSLKYALSKNS